MNIRVGKKGTTVHLGLWDRDGTAITRRACRRKNFTNAGRFLPTVDPVTCKVCVRLRDESPGWLVRAAYGNDPATAALAQGNAVVLPHDVPLAWCARCGEQYPKPAGRYAATVDGNVCVPCFDRLRGTER
ncbi:hypothetical protein [Nocardioides baekrokdamisoli]|nr:hypothetical protein [Nocardioides baekrokdamisoli]